MANDLIRRAEAWLASPEAMTAADDLISDLLAALKAQQPAPDGHVATVAEVHMSRYTIEWVNGPLPEGTPLYAAQQPAPVDAEGLPPLPEPVGVLHRGNGGEWWFSCGDNLRNLYAQPMGEHNLYTSDQLRRAQREAMAVERERWMKLCKDAAQRYFSGGFGEAAGACTHLHAQGSAIRQGASHD